MDLSLGLEPSKGISQGWLKNPTKPSTVVKSLLPTGPRNTIQWGYKEENLK